MNEEQVRYEAKARGLRLNRISESQRVYDRGYRWRAVDKDKSGIFGNSIVAANLDGIYHLIKYMPIVIEGYQSTTKPSKVTKITAVLYITTMHDLQGTVMVYRGTAHSTLYGMDRRLTRATINRLFGLIKVANTFQIYPSQGEYICLEIEA